MRLSVVIPTYNRRERLDRVLRAVERQRSDVPGGVEVIVVDDGSVDGTPEFLRQKESEGRLRWLAPGHGGPAKARNAGARAASGEVVVFLGDDMEPEPGFLAAHEAAHRPSPETEPFAVLGHTSWDAERLRVTPLLKHLDHRGLQFGFSLIEDPENVPFNFFYASNASLPLSLFLSHGGFDEAFDVAAWEDAEFAYRASLAEPSLRVVYRREARARHDHPTTVASFRERQRRAGVAAATFALKHPEMAKWLGQEDAARLAPRRPFHLTLLEAAVRAADTVGVGLPGIFYDKLFRWDYLAGFHEALRGPRAKAASREKDIAAPPRKAAGLH